jgi:hypothetical protein
VGIYAAKSGRGSGYVGWRGGEGYWPDATDNSRPNAKTRYALSHDHDKSHWSNISVSRLFMQSLPDLKYHFVNLRREKLWSCHLFVQFVQTPWYLWYAISHHAQGNIYSSSPKKTLIGSHASPQTLKRSGSELISFISSSVSSQPSSWKLPWMRDAVTDLGMTELPLWRPHMRSTCWTDLPLLSASFFSFSFL